MKTIQPLEKPREEESSQSLESSDIVKQIQDLIQNETSSHAVLRHALPMLGQRFRCLFGVATCEHDKQPITVRYEPKPDGRAKWGSQCDGLILEARYRNQASAKRIRVSEGTEEGVAFAVPMIIAGQGTIGVVVLVGPVSNRETMESQLVALQSLLAVVALAWTNNSTTAQTRSASADNSDNASLKKIAKYGTFSEFAYAFTNSLKVRLNCEQVALAWVRRNRPQIACVSGCDRVHRSTPGIQLLEQAMSEAIDANTLSQSRLRSSEKSEPEIDYPLHRCWREQSGATLTATIPLRYEDQLVGLLSIRDGREKPLNSAQLEKTQDIVDSMVPGICLLRRADRPVMSHVRNAIAKKLQAIGLRSARVRVVAAVVLASAIALLGFGKFEHTVVAPCEFTPTGQTAITSPTSAKLNKCHVVVGDMVRQGDLIATLDSEELISEKDALEYELASVTTKQFQAIQESDVAVAAQLDFERRAIEARLETNQWMLDNIEIRSPIDGVVLANLATPLIGSKLSTGQPLFEIVPLGEFQLQIEVGASNIDNVSPGQHATVVPQSHPDTQLSCVIDSVEYLVADEETGRRVRVHATLLDTAPEWVRIGSPAIAHVKTGNRPGWWIALHRTIDKIRLHAWRISS